MCGVNRRRKLTSRTVFQAAHGAIFVSLNFISTWDMSVPRKVKPNSTRFFALGIGRRFEGLAAIYVLIHKNYINKQ